MSQKIRIKLKSYDHNLVDNSAEKIVKTVKSTGAVDKYFNRFLSIIKVLNLFT